MENEPVKEKPKTSNTLVRLLTALVAAPFILGMLFWLPKTVFLIFVFIAIAVASLELSGMVVPGRRVLRGVQLLLTLGVTAVYVFEPNLLAPSVLALALIAMLANLAGPEPIDTAGARVAWTFGGPIYIGALLASIPLLHHLDNGGSWVLLTMFFAWFGDTGGYFAGRAFGKRKLYPVVSPKKTVEGAIGGLVGSALGAVLAHFTLLPELPLAEGIALGVVAGALGQAGDLCESLIKRNAGVKDSGWIVPGHGGLLDRIDALMFVAPVTWLYATYLLPL